MVNYESSTKRLHDQSAFTTDGWWRCWRRPWMPRAVLNRVPYSAQIDPFALALAGLREMDRFERWRAGRLRFQRSRLSRGLRALEPLRASPVPFSARQERPATRVWAAYTSLPGAHPPWAGCPPSAGIRVACSYGDHTARSTAVDSFLLRPMNCSRPLWQPQRQAGCRM